MHLSVPKPAALLAIQSMCARVVPGTKAVSALDPGYVQPCKCWVRV